MSPLAVDGPLRVLLVIANPRDLPPLDVAGEKDRVQEALASLCHEGLVTLECLEQTTKFALQDYIRQGYHVFHFIGHGTYSSDGGQLFLQDIFQRHVLVS